MKTNSIIVNGKEILILTEANEKFVAIKPICEAIGVNYETQKDKILSDEILGSVTPLRGATGSDGKEYKMRVIPFRFVFGWLFTINPKNVKSEIKDQMIKYKMECYNALFDSFTKRSAVLKEKTEYQVEIEKLENELKEDEKYKRIQELKASISNATRRLNSMDKDIISEQLDLFSKEGEEE